MSAGKKSHELDVAMANVGNAGASRIGAIVAEQVQNQETQDRWVLSFSLKELVFEGLPRPSSDSKILKPSLFF